jgi:hypothetical protein
MGYIILAGSGILFYFPGCHRAGQPEETEVHPNVPVTVTSIHTGKFVDYTELTATSSFLIKAVIKSPVSGYVDQCNMIPGDKVVKGEEIFRLRTKESQALEGDSLSQLAFSGMIRIRASIDGTIVSIEHPKGDYVQEGDPLTTIVMPSSLVFILEAPMELRKFIRQGNSCELLLPGNETLMATIKSVLPSMTGSSQTQRVILQPHAESFLPENLIAKVKIVKDIRQNAVILPKSCILSDEIMKNFWVMKLVNDSTAVKIPVITGVTNADSAEILSPVLDPKDLFLSSGNYGLGDSVTVKVIHK